MAAVGHVVALDTGTHFAPHPGQRLFFDDAARCLHVVEGRLISACLLPGAPGPAAEPPAAPAGDGNGSSDGEADSEAGSTDSGRAFLVSSGPPVALLRAAPGVGVTALQRSARVLELTDHLTGNLFVASPTDARGRHGADLLGFFWTSAEDLVLVTAHGLEAYALQASFLALPFYFFCCYLLCPCSQRGLWWAAASVEAAACGLFCCLWDWRLGAVAGR